jgi:hypothetical protein
LWWEKTRTSHGKTLFNLAWFIISNREKQADVHIPFRRCAKRHNFAAIVDLERIENDAIRPRQDKVAQGEDLAIFPKVWITADATHAGITDHLVKDVDRFTVAASVSVRRS